MRKNFIQKSYDFASNIYGDKENNFWRMEFENLSTFIKSRIQSNFLRKLKKKDIIDVGCGNGFSSKLFKEAYPEVKKIIGIDISNKMLEKAHNDLGEIFISIKGDISENGTWEKIPFKVDGVISFFVLHWINETAVGDVIKNIYKVLKPSGWFIGSIFGEFEMFPGFLSLIEDVIKIFTDINTDHVTSLWNIRNSSMIEKLFVETDFRKIQLSSYIVNKEHTIDAAINLIFYRFGFWVQAIPLQFRNKAKEKLKEFLIEDLKPQKGIVNLKEHIVAWECQK